MITCKKCKADNFPEKIRLIGGLNTYLCFNCMNKWHELISFKSDLMTKMYIFDRQLDACKDFDEIESLCKLKAELERKVYEVSISWIEQDESI